jgi:hypothetical protein
MIRSSAVSAARSAPAYSGPSAVGAFQAQRDQMLVEHREHVIALGQQVGEPFRVVDAADGVVGQLIERLTQQVRFARGGGPCGRRFANGGDDAMCRTRGHSWFALVDLLTRYVRRRVCGAVRDVVRNVVLYAVRFAGAS